ncbi:hypothetical protein ASZ90_016024 [hydrocarbon metagenome]|uniref:Uncharacterized protein n=1 Tax=hydrocarbon metagenome TaxID=938273 RepID=A0A0W8F0B0_9ZZZZ
MAILRSLIDQINVIHRDCYMLITKNLIYKTYAKFAKKEEKIGSDCAK